MTTSVKSRLFQYIPALESLKDYRMSYLHRDVFAGLTVAAVAVPQAMAYATIFDMPVEMGLFTAIVMTTVGALLDSSKQLINGPTNAISIAMLSALAVIPESQRIQAAIMMALLIGLIQTTIAILRFGDLSRFVSHAVIVGFTLGASVLLVLDQLKNVLGLKSKGSHDDHFLTRFWMTLSDGGNIHWPTVAVALGTIILAIGFRFLNSRFKLRLPELLLAIAVIATILAFADPMKTSGVKLVDKVPQALPSFQLPTLDLQMGRELFGSAAAIAFLGLLEAIAMAKSIASKTGQKLDMNQQCLSEGVANMAGSFFRCFPGSGSLTRSFINHTSGAATQWSGVVSAIGVALTILFLAPFSQYIPRAALAGVLILTAMRMVDPASLKYYWRATRFDALILAATALSAVLISIEFCILIGVVLSFIFYVPRAAKISMSELTVTNRRVIREVQPNDYRCPSLRIYNLEGELFFGSSADFESLLELIETDIPDSLRILIFRVKRIRNPDAVCVQILQGFVERLKKRNVVVMLSGIRPDLMMILKNVKMDRLLGPDNLFSEGAEIWASTLDAMRKAYEMIGENRCEQCPNRNKMVGPPTDWSYMI